MQLLQCFFLFDFLLLFSFNCSLLNFLHSHPICLGLLQWKYFISIFELDFPLNFSRLSYLWGFLLLLLPHLSVISASEWKEIHCYFLLASSLNMLSFIIPIVITPLGAKLQSDTTMVSQLSSKELNTSNAYTSSSNGNFIVDSTFNNPWKSLRCSIRTIVLCLSLYFKFISLLITKALFWAVFCS